MKQFSFRLEKIEDLSGCLDEFMQICPVVYRSIVVSVFTDWADPDLAQALIRGISERLPRAVLAGFTGGGGIWQGRRCEQQTILTFMVFEQVEASIQVFDCEIQNEEHIGRDLLEKCCKIKDLAAVELFATLNNIQAGPIFHALSELDSRIQIFGGGANSYDPRRPGFIFARKGVFLRGILAICFAGKGLHVHMNSNIGWKPLGNPLAITQMGDQDYIVKELNHQPAISVYKRYLNLTPHNNFLQETLAFPFILERNGQSIVRHPIDYRSDGSLVFAGDFKPNEKIRLSYGNPSEILKSAQESRRDIAEFGPEGILLFSCIGRQMFLQDGVNQELAAYQGMAPLSGLYTYGEIMRLEGRVEILNITLLSVVFREGPNMQSGQVGPISVTPQSEEMSLTQRLAYFVPVTSAELEAANHKLSRLAKTDALTKLRNRGDIESILVEHVRYFQQRKQPLSAIMLDLDDFKRINDTYGHDIGDEALKFVAGVLEKNIRYYDRAGRWGGEEFLLILPGASLDHARLAAERIRCHIANGWFLPDQKRITSSIGVCEVQQNETYPAFYTRLDKTLYAAKTSGKNKVAG